MSNVAIEVKNLTKRYREVVAVNKLSMSVSKGEIYGFLGPNGAGKTTTLKIIMGLVHPDEGEVLISGRKMDTEIKKKIGFLPEKLSFYDNLTPVEILEFFAELKEADKKDIPVILKDVGLYEAQNRKVKGFSKGMLQLLGIAQAMLGEPKIYVLDEPMSGLDARWRKYFKDKLKMLNKHGVTILFSSHILAEVEDICDRVGIIHKGRLLFEGRVEELQRALSLKPRIEIQIEGLAGRIPEGIKSLEGVAEVSASSDWLSVVCEYSARAEVIKVIERTGLKILDIRTSEPSLEESFDLLLSKVEGRK